MSDQDLFENNKNTNTPPVTSSPDDLLKTIVNEEGVPKYDTVEKALSGLAASQAHIKKLEEESRARQEEMNQLREQTKSQKSIEEVLERLTSQNQSQQQQTTPASGGLDEEKLKAIVLETLGNQQSVATHKQNLQSVQAKLVEQFGEKAQEKIAATAAALDMTPQELGELAKTKPKAVLGFFASQSNNSPAPTPPGSSVPVGLPSENPPTKFKGLLMGASAKDQAEAMRAIKEQVYKTYDVTT